MRSLRYRLTLWFSLAVTATGGTVAWVGFLLVQKQMLAGLDFLLDAEVQEIIERLDDKPLVVSDKEIFEAVAGHTLIDAPLYYFQIRRTGHGIVFRSSNLGDAELRPIPPGGPRTHSSQVGENSIRQIERKFRDFDVQVATSLDQFNALITRYRHSLLIGFPMLFAASLAVGVMLTTVALRPIRAMQKSARRISASNLSERLPVPAGGDEISDLARLLNDLFGRLEASFEQIKRFTADASHELKTPLSLIRLHAERLSQSPLLDAAARNAVNEQLEEVARLSKLIENLLLLARADAGSLHLETKLQNTAVYISDFAEDAAALAEDRNRRFALGANEPAQIRFDPVLIRHVLLNLLSNGIRHTPESRQITLNSRMDGDWWLISVEDEGPGLPDAEMQSIFGRFVRRTATGVEPSEGSGLGLAIAQSIVEAHKGRIEATNRVDGGLAVQVHLPKADR